MGRSPRSSGGRRIRVNQIGHGSQGSNRSPVFPAHLWISIEVFGRDALVTFRVPLRSRKSRGFPQQPVRSREMSGTGSRNGRDTAALSTLPSQANVSPTWKQEVNQLVAAHKDRRTVSAEEPETQSESLHSASSRAAAAAARAAARFANAPSYSETLANEARAAIRAAEAASKAALEAQAVAEQVLAEIEAASAAQPSW